jgi:hypothetical protein
MVDIIDIWQHTCLNDTKGKEKSYRTTARFGGKAKTKDRRKIEKELLLNGESTT